MEDCLFRQLITLKLKDQRINFELYKEGLDLSRVYYSLSISLNKLLALDECKK